MNAVDLFLHFLQWANHFTWLSAVPPAGSATCTHVVACHVVDGGSWFDATTMAHALGGVVEQVSN